MRRIWTAGACATAMSVCAAVVAIGAPASAVEHRTAATPSAPPRVVLEPTWHAVSFHLRPGLCSYAAIWARGIGSCAEDGQGSTPPFQGGVTIDWDQGGPTAVHVHIGSAILDGNVSSPGSPAFNVVDGSVPHWDANSAITSGTAAAPGEINGPLKIDARSVSDKPSEVQYAFTITGYLRYSQSGQRLSTTTVLKAPASTPEGVPVSVSAVVEPYKQYDPSTGYVTFSANGPRPNRGCTQVVLDTSNRASCQLDRLVVGTYTVEAYFHGTGLRESSTSPPATLTVTDQPAVQVSTTQLELTAPMRTTSLPQSVTIRPASSAKVTVSKLGIEGSGSFRITDQDCVGRQLRRPASCTVLINYTSTNSPEDATLVIDDDAVGAPQKGALRGNPT